MGSPRCRPLESKGPVLSPGAAAASRRRLEAGVGNGEWCPVTGWVTHGELDRVDVDGRRSHSEDAERDRHRVGCDWTFDDVLAPRRVANRTVFHVVEKTDHLGGTVDAQPESSPSLSIEVGNAHLSTHPDGPAAQRVRA
jgi:hypothetical protein